MKLHIAKSAGFCFGVKRAMELALRPQRKILNSSTLWASDP